MEATKTPKMTKTMTRAMTALKVNTSHPKAKLILAARFFHCRVKGSEICNRCYGSGRVNSQRDGGVCYKCSGLGFTAVSRVTEEQAADAEAAALDGRLEGYLAFLRFQKIQQNATKMTLEVWKATGIGDLYQWMQAATDKQAGTTSIHTELADLNALMCAEYDRVKASSSKVGSALWKMKMNDEGRKPLVEGLAHEVEAACQTIKELAEGIQPILQKYQ